MFGLQDDSSILYRNKCRALDAGFPGVAALRVAREQDPRIAAEDFPLMHMAKRPIVVAVIAQLGDGAWGIVVVPFTAVDRCVQQADIEMTGDMGRIGQRDIIGDRTGAEALAVDADIEPPESDG